MKILFLHGHMFNSHTWSCVAKQLRPQGIELLFFSQLDREEAALAALASGEVDLCIAQLFPELPQYQDLLEQSQQVPHRIALGQEPQPGFTTCSPTEQARFARYLREVDAVNYANGIRYLLGCCGWPLTSEPPRPVCTLGIYHPEAEALFATAHTYLHWLDQRLDPERPLVALLFYCGQLAEHNHAEVDALIQALQQYGFRPLCLATEALADGTLPQEERYPWLPILRETRPVALMNLLAGRVLARQEDSVLLTTLNLPVFQLIRLYQQTPWEWREDSAGLTKGAASLVFSLTQPEMAGVIEPTAIAATVPQHDADTGLSLRRYVPLTDRIDQLCRRLKRWVRLQTLENREKRVTIVLHNNPCKGVEATLGLAAGLDTFASLARCIRALRETGYQVDGAPENGQELLDTLLARKALSEFRWTTADEIVRKGGVLHRTNRREYEMLLSALPTKARNKVREDWGEFPGEGMVAEDTGEPTLLITGLQYGNLRIMLQPKRGCYGAKCNGEVCRILHDPLLSPPPHWLATYRYIRDHSDVVLHFGAHGALEFLPGKQVALSEQCFPEISLDDLPNVYLYVMDVPGEGLIAKRRARAVIVDHLTPVLRPAPLDADTTELEGLLLQYQHAVEQGKGPRRALLQEQMVPLMRTFGALTGPVNDESFAQGVALLSRRITRSKRTLATQGLHRLGEAPSTEGMATMLATIRRNPHPDLPGIEQIASWHPDQAPDDFTAACQVLGQLLTNQPEELNAEEGQNPARRRLGHWAREVGSQLAASTREIPQLLKALNGGYIEPGLSGSLSLGKTQTLPTGRNFFASDVQALPTRAAWEVGCELADNLLRRYLQEENRFPESVGISLWSIDAFKADGEVFCQILHLMGMQPVWGADGRVTGITPQPLSALRLEVGGTRRPRPRVDAVIQTSCILRDMVPHFADLLDEAAVLAGELEEPVSENFIRKHTLERLQELKAELQDRLPDNELQRLASFRVFSSAPGAGGTGVNLALDASAWEDEQDLAETYINWSGYAYGSSRAGQGGRVVGREAQQLLARHLQGVDVTYMRQYSPEYDLVDCSCYAGAIGGMSVAARAVSGKRAKLYWADVNSEGDHSIRDLQEDLEASVMAKLLNQHWLSQQKEHGYKGASEMASLVNNLFKWSATTKTVDKWVFDRVTATYIEDAEMLAWLRQHNPYALEEMSRRLLEAQSRGLWEAEEAQLTVLQEAALAIEGDMEETIGEVTGEFQGSRVEVLTARDVETWQPTWRIGR